MDADSVATAAREFAEETLVSWLVVLGAGAWGWRLRRVRAEVCSRRAALHARPPDWSLPPHPMQGLFGAVGVDAAAVAAAAAAAEVRLRDPKLSLKVVHPLKKGSYHL